MNYILYGEQAPMIKKRLKKILLERLGEPDEFNVSKLDYEENEFQEIADECAFLPLGYEKKAVVIDNCVPLASSAKKEEKERLLEMLQNSSDDIDIILIHHSGSLDEKGAIFNYVKENGKIFNFVNLTKEEWPRYVKKYFEDRNVDIEPLAISELVSRVEGDLTKFLNEADKLCLYKNKLTLLDITLMVAKPIEDDVFQISNALFRGDNATALSIYRDLQLLGSKATDTLVPMLGSSFRFVSECKFLFDRGLEKNEIAQQLGTSEGRVAITLKNSRYLSRIQIQHAIDDLYYLDYQIKSGQIDRFYGFELFLINFPN